MAETPPPQFAGYPRGPVTPRGTAERAQALADGYFGLNNVFLVNILLAIGLRAAVAQASLALTLGAVLIMLVAIAALSYPQNQRIAFGKGRPNSYAVVASVLMGINSALCCGIIGYLVMQNIALNELKRMGIRGGGFFGLKKANVQVQIQQLRLAEGTPPPPAVPPV